MVASSANLFVKLFVLVKNKIKVVGSIFSYLFTLILVPLHLTVILSIFAVDGVVSRYIAGC